MVRRTGITDRCTIVWSFPEKASHGDSPQKGRQHRTTGGASRPRRRAYGNFASELYAEIRAEVIGEGIGQQAVVLVSHDRRLIGAVANRFMVIERSRLGESEGPEPLYELLQQGQLLTARRNPAD